VPLSLTNAMAVAAGAAHSVALKGDGTVVAWGDHGSGQTNIPNTLIEVKMIAANGSHTLAGRFSPLVQYPVDVAQDLLLIYNTNLPDSQAVMNYYRTNRPMVANANVLGIGGATTNAERYSDLSETTSNLVTPVLN